MGFALLLSCGSSNSPSSSSQPSNEILYVINSGMVVTYSIDPATLTATTLEQPLTLTGSGEQLLQFDPSPRDNYVYAVWSDGQSIQHLSVFVTDASGVPQGPAMQVLNANSLSQFNMHPSGRFAYMLEVTNSNNQYTASIRLFSVLQGAGTLVENARVQGTYGPAPIWPAFLYGFDASGSVLYDTSNEASGIVYRQRAIDQHNGTLGADRQILSLSSRGEVVLGPVFVAQYQNGTSPSENYLNIYANVANPKTPLVHCTIGMLSACATATNVQLDKSGKFLFLTDPASQSVHVARINLALKRIADTGYSLPMTSQTPGFAFSPDGKIVYAMLVSDQSLHFYHFNTGNGSLTEGGAPLPLGFDTGIAPALHL